MNTGVARWLAPLLGGVLLLGAAPAWATPPAPGAPLAQQISSQPLAQQISSQPLAQQISSRIDAEVEAPTGSIRVAEQDGRVVLLGEVMLLEHALQAERIAWTTPGVADVDNELRVVPLTAGTDASIEADVRTIIKAEGRFVDTSLQVVVQAGVVKLRGLFQNPADVLALKHRVASVPGVVDVRIEALLVAVASPLHSSSFSI